MPKAHNLLGISIYFEIYIIKERVDDMKKLIVALCVCLIVTGLGDRVEALSTYSTTSFSFTNPMGAIGVTPFNQNLGTLEEIIVSIDGQISGTAFIDPATVIIPSQTTPTSYFIEISQAFDGALGKYFDFASPAKYRFSGDNYLNAVTAISLYSSFSFDFTINAETDLMGGNVFPTFSGMNLALPPTSIFSLRNNFFETKYTADEILYNSYVSNGYGFSAVDLSAGGSMIIEYVYEPAPVPEPSTLLLLGCGLLGLGWYGRKRRKA